MVDMEETEERAKQIVQMYRPGAYFFKGSSEEIARAYIKMEKERWLRLAKHDYALALIRRDSDAASKLRKAYNALAQMFDWKEDVLRGVEEKVATKPREVAEEAVESLFQEYVTEVQEKTFMDFDGTKFPLGAWRERPDEKVWEAIFRLGEELTVRGALFREEWGLWRLLEDELSKMAKEVRLGDRVAYWFAVRLGEKVRDCTTPPEYEAEELKGVKPEEKEPKDIWLEDAIEDSVAGREVSYWEAEERTHLSRADYWRKHSTNVFYAQFAVKEVIMALMARVHVDPRAGYDLEDFLKQVTEKVGIPSLMKLYDEAMKGPPEYQRLDRFSEGYWEKVKPIHEEMIKKCRVFVGVMRHVFFTRPEEREFTIVIDGKEF